MDTRQSQPGHAMASRELVENILATLEPEEGLLIRLLDLEECSIAEVQQVTGWSAVSVRVRAFRARQKLNKRFARLKNQRREHLWDWPPATLFAGPVCGKTLSCERAAI